MIGAIVRLYVANAACTSHHPLGNQYPGHELLRL